MRVTVYLEVDDREVYWTVIERVACPEIGDEIFFESSPRKVMDRTFFIRRNEAAMTLVLQNIVI